MDRFDNADDDRMRSGGTLDDWRELARDRCYRPGATLTHRLFVELVSPSPAYADLLAGLTAPDGSEDAPDSAACPCRDAGGHTYASPCAAQAESRRGPRR